MARHCRQVSVPFRGFRGLQGFDRRAGRQVRGDVFQSPSGVLGVCRTQGQNGRFIRLCVSVPFRGFRGLQAGLRQDPASAVHVSVPFRGFRGLQEPIDVKAARIALGVSVPFRGFRGLQDSNVKPENFSSVRVSVPFRGFRGLQARSQHRSACVGRCFSPLPGF